MPTETQKTPAYITWIGMKQRCLYKKHKNYAVYGGAGIKIFPAWLLFKNFLADMGPRPEGTTLDRFPNPKGNYEPGNCRWANRSQQMTNRCSTRWITFNGKTQSIAQWSRELGVARGRIDFRLDSLKWSVEKTLTHPSRYSKPRAAFPDTLPATCQ